LPKPVKNPILALDAAVPSDSSSPQTCRLQALVDMARPLPLTDARPATPGQAPAHHEGTDPPASPTLRPLGKVAQQSLPAPSGSFRLETGGDGRVRLALTPQKRQEASTRSPVPAPFRRRLGRKMSEEEARAKFTGSATEAIDAELTAQDVSRSPSPVPTEVVPDEGDSLSQELNSLAVHQGQDSSGSSSSSLIREEEVDNEVEW